MYDQPHCTRNGGLVPWTGAQALLWKGTQNVPFVPLLTMPFEIWCVWYKRYSKYRYEEWPLAEKSSHNRINKCVVYKRSRLPLCLSKCVGWSQASLNNTQHWKKVWFVLNWTCQCYVWSYLSKNPIWKILSENPKLHSKSYIYHYIGKKAWVAVNATYECLLEVIFWESQTLR